ncbi:MAG: ABC transporter permease subunit, partial [Eubacteriales bacterium]
MLLTLLIITLICFVLIRMLPLKELPIGDPHTDVILAQREAFGYNKPYLVQFGIFLKNIFTRFDWGISDQLYFGQNVADIFLSKLPATMLINVYSIVLSIPFGIILGIVAAMKKNSWIDHTISTLTMVIISVPSFVYAFLIQYFLCFKL